MSNSSALAKYVGARRFGGRTAYDLAKYEFLYRLCIIVQRYPAALRPIDPADLCNIAAEAYGAVAKVE